MTVRSAEVRDAKRLLEIYAYYVENTAVSFEWAVPTLEEFQNRIENTIKKYPYFVIEENGIIQGYAYAGAFRIRAAYARSCELSIYLDHKAHGHGYGRMLYEALEAELKKMGILNLYACIASPIREDEYLTDNSERFHQHLGFSKVGEFHQCSYKFNRWYNMIWMEKIIGEHEETEDPCESAIPLKQEEAAEKKPKVRIILGNKKANPTKSGSAGEIRIDRDAFMKRECSSRSTEAENQKQKAPENSEKKPLRTGQNSCEKKEK